MSFSVIESSTSSAWHRLSARVKQRAHTLRQALAPALELHFSGRWGRPEIENAGLQAYRAAFVAKFPRVISGGFWRGC